MGQQAQPSSVFIDSSCIVSNIVRGDGYVISSFTNVVSKYSLIIEKYEKSAFVVTESTRGSQAARNNNKHTNVEVF